ncbi:MAG: efflux RND transporter periplasmic adaptor subunit [Planctomycetes bacterium]|nr:efflux RND transporter periplasmic adaptor subunit [Planctomycetota bacterium]
MPSPRVPVLLVLALLASACSFKGPGAKTPDPKSKEKKAESPTQELELVRAEAPTRGDLSARLQLTARVIALERAEVLPRIEGLVVAIAVEEGQDVEAGTELARIEDDQARIAEEKTEVALAQAELATRVAQIAREEAESRRSAAQVTRDKRASDLDRAEAQFKKNALAEQDLEKARYDRETADADLRQAELQLRKAAMEVSKAELAMKDARIAHEKAVLDRSWTRITAPIKGRVMRRNVRLGQKASPAQAVFVIADPNSLVIEPKIPEKDLRVVAPGLPVLLESTSYPGIEYRGRIALIAPEVEAEGGSLKVRIELEAGEPALRPGLFVSGHIETERHEDALLLPKKALLFDRDRPYVFVIDRQGEGNTVRKVYVRRGLQDALHVEYLPAEGGEAEIDATSRIVVVGLDKLVDGAAVRIEGEDLTPPETGGGPDDAGKDA